MLEATAVIGEPAIRADGIDCREITDLAIHALATRTPPAHWPAPGTWCDHEDGRLARIGADQCFMLSRGGGAIPAADGSYVSDQSDSWAIIGLSGERISVLLERLSMIDLETAPARLASRTVMHHIPVILLRLAPQDLLLLTPRSTAGDFWCALGEQIRAMA
ncbi:MAG: hypothetical protein R3C70_16320 [Geminicoccaceae bacterium]